MSSSPATLAEETTAPKSIMLEEQPSDQALLEKDLTTVDEHPDGGLRAWLSVLGAAFSMFSTIGIVSSWGVFQGYYKAEILVHSSPSSIAWIGGLQYFLMYLPGVLAGRLFDIGWFKIPMVIASALLFMSTFLVGECTQYWHFLLCQGVATGLACGLIWSPTMSVLGHWFKRRLGVAIALATIGSSIGGTLFPIAARHLIPTVGFPWTMRIFGFVLIFTLTAMNLCLTRRLPPTKGDLRNLLGFDLLRDPPYGVYCVAGVIMFLGVYVLSTFISSSAREHGVPEEFSFYLVTIINSCSIAGRLSAGFLIDYFGAINTLAPTALITAALTYAWPFATTKGSLIAIAALYGVFSGSVVASFMAPVFYMGDVRDVGRRSGLAGTLAAFGDLFGLPIAGAIERVGYEAMGYYGGSCIVFACVLMMITKSLALGGIRGKY